MLDALDADTYAFWTGFTGGPGTASGVDAGASWYRTGIPSTNYNGILGASTDGHIDALIDRARAWGIPSRWMLSSESMPQGFDRALERHGLPLLDEAPGMVARIAKLRKPRANALSVEIVCDEEQFAEWLDVFFVDALGLPSELAAHASLAHGHPRMRDPRRTYLLMRSGGAAVATGLLHASAPGVAGIYGIGVRRAFQKRGLGALATVLTCDAGARTGADVAVLQATKAGFPVYERLGFTTITSYRSWRLS